MEDLAYTTIILSEPRPEKFLLHLGKQPIWIVNVIKAWNINLQQGSSTAQMSIGE